MKKLFALTLSLMLICQLYAQKEYNIGILLDYQTPQLEPLLERLKNQIAAVVGEDAKVFFPPQYFLSNQYKVDEAVKNYNLLVEQDLDLILAFGAVNTYMLSKKESFEVPTILMGTFSRVFWGFPNSQKTSGIDNFTCLIETESFNEDFVGFQQLTNYRNIGIVVDESLFDVLPLEEVFENQLEALEGDFQLIPYKSLDDIWAKLDDVDALYLTEDYLLSESEVDKLIEKLIELKIPSFTNNYVYVVKGMFATTLNFNNVEQVIRRLSLMVESFVNGTALKDMPVSFDLDERLTINVNTAQLIDIPLKYSLISNIDIVGDIKNASATKRYNLYTLINEVLERNLSLKSSESNVLLDKQEVKAAKNNYLPHLTASGTGTYIDPDVAEISGGSNPEFSTSGNITLQQTVFSEAANANIAIQNKMFQAAEEDYKAETLDLIYNAASAYFTSLIIKANTEIRYLNLNLTNRNLEIAQQNFEAGESGKADLLRFRSEKAQNKQAFIESANQLRESYIVLNQLLNNPVDLNIDIEDVRMENGMFKGYYHSAFFNLLDSPDLKEHFVDFVVKKALENAPEIKSVSYQFEANERNLKLNSGGRLMPTVALQGQYNHIFSRSGKGSSAPQGRSLLDKNYNIGLNLSIPIFNQNQTNVSRQSALIRRDQIEINRENLEQVISANVRIAILNLGSQISNLELSKVSEEAAKEAFDLTQTAYNSGAVSIIHLLDAQNNYLAARLAHTSAVYNYMLESINLERQVGYYFMLGTEEETHAFASEFMEFLGTENSEKIKNINR